MKKNTFFSFSEWKPIRFIACALLLFLLGRVDSVFAAENLYSGIVGVESYDVEQARFNVETFCNKAKELGLNYLVFTEDVKNLNELKWNQLVENCKTNSNDSFIAIPGIKYKDSGWKANFMCFSMQKWINPSYITPEGLINNQSGVLFGLNWPAMALCTPSDNGFPPWAVKFYTGFAVFTYKDGALTENAFDQYLRQQGNCYNLFPIAAYDINNPSDLANKIGFKTWVKASNVSDIPQEFRERRSVFVSDGPRVTDWKIENESGAFPEQPWQLSFSASAATTIREVIIYDKNEVYRRFLPNSKDFSATITGWPDKQHYFVMRVVDEAGKEAITSVYNTTDYRHHLFMCADQQNTLDGGNAVDKETDEIVSLGIMGSYDTGWNGGAPGVLVPTAELFPEGLDYVVKSFRFYAAGINTQEGTEHPIAKRSLVFGSGDCTILDNYFQAKLGPNSTFAPSVHSDVRERYISFTPRLYSYNALLIEARTVIKKTLRLADSEGPQIVPVTVTADTFENYTYWSDDDTRQTGKVDAKTSLTAKILKGGYVSLWPNFYGAFALYTFDTNQTVSIKNTTVQIGLHDPGKELAAGTVFNHKYLLVRDKFGSDSDEGFTALRGVYGFKGQPAYNVVLSQGKVVDNVFALTLQASEGFVSGVISKADLPNDLPIIAKGLNGNWDAGLYDRKTAEFRRVGIFEGAAYTTLDLSTERDVFIGNLLTCDNPKVKLLITKIDKTKIEIEAHNPTDQSVSITIRSPKALSLFPAIMTKSVLKPGESKMIQYPLAQENK